MAASLGSGPESETLTTDSPDLLGALEVGLGVAWRSATAEFPINLVDLPKSDIERAISVVVH